LVARLKGCPCNEESAARYNRQAMEKKLEPLSVFTRDNQIWIEQSYDTDESRVVISIEQIPILIKWLEEAKAEIDNHTA